jgi:hypothetical protein
MPRPRKDLTEFRDEIERRIRAKETYNQIRNWLATQGVIISKNTFFAQCGAWEINRNTRTAASNPALINAINTAFHTTNWDDNTIAESISADGISTTHNQVKEIRLAHNWRRRANNEVQLADARAQTFHLIKDTLNQGVVRCYGRGLLRTYLRVAYTHNAREDNVRDALGVLDQEGTQSRRKGVDKRSTTGEYITPSPDWLWCCDGHDKFRNYGIKIYAGVDAYSRRIQWYYVGNSNRRAVGILQ